MRKMTSYPLLLAVLLALLLAGGAAGGAEPPAAKAAASPGRYQQAAGSGSLAFAFEQAGAENRGSFRQFATELGYDANNLAASTLKVTVQIASLDTQDKDRDDTLLSEELFAAKQHPTAQFVASSLARRANGGLEAVGKLTLRGITHELRLPLTIRPTANGVEISGETTLRRLEYGVGQGDWKSTEWVGDEVKLQYKVPLTRAG